MNQTIETEFAVEVEIDRRKAYIVVGRNPSIGTDEDSQLIAVLRSRAETRNIFTLDQFLNSAAANNRGVKNLVLEAYRDVKEKDKLNLLHEIRKGSYRNDSFFTKMIATGLIWTGKTDD